MPLIRNTLLEHQGDDQPAGFQALFDALHNPEAAARRLAARGLVDAPGGSTALVERLEEESESSVREALITSLAAIADVTAVTALIDCLRSEDAALRNDAIEALKTAGSQHPALIQDALQDYDADVRILAVGILESLKHPDVELWLIDLLEHDSHLNVCACAVDLLCELGTERAVPALELCLERFPNEDYLRFVVDLAIKRLRGESSL
ncbi:HEAT repeat protein [Pseudomonas duriflava]|uniref:HEAT repeat protein n=1 Tax=Pseudomonas duriflava TaxID=459528 RepID=A0A562Q9M2_9PSED|nr:HEAT repeat domain-containing protein [Pseudomonas duriflava]TWI52726.1 HEAT repeat protein [Pseudomonas duriflava]